MSKKPPTDTFTRFTSSTPNFASPQPSPTSTFSSSAPPNTTNFNVKNAAYPPQEAPGGAPPNETPRERVARLRAAHNAKKVASLSTSDRLISRGRGIADVLHRATTYSLLGFSAIATVVAAYGLVSLVSHNRTQKRAWIEREMDRLEEARASFLRGEASAEQLHLLQQERAGEEIKRLHEQEQERKRREGIMGRFRGLFSSGDNSKKVVMAGGIPVDLNEKNLLEEKGDPERIGTPSEETRDTQRRFRVNGDDVELRSAVVAESGVPGVGIDEKGRPVPMGKMVRVKKGREEAREAQSSILEAVQMQRGGQLDTLASNLGNSGKGLWSSIFGGESSSKPSTSR